MAIGIDIRVNGTDQLKSAKLETELLSGALRDARELGTIDIAPRGISELISELKQIGSESRAAIGNISDIAAEMRRLSGIRFDVSAPPAPAPRQPEPHGTGAEPSPVAKVAPTAEPARLTLQERLYGTPAPRHVDHHFDSSNLGSHKAPKIVSPVVSEKIEQAATIHKTVTQQPAGLAPGARPVTPRTESIATEQRQTEKPQSHYEALIRRPAAAPRQETTGTTNEPVPQPRQVTPSPVTPRTEQAAQQQTTRPESETPRKAHREKSDATSSEQAWKKIEGTPQPPKDFEAYKTSTEDYRQIMQDTQRLQKIGERGELQGDKLSTKQLDEFKLLTERVSKNISAWERDITKAQAALAKLNTEQKKLEKTSTKDPAAWITAQNRLQEIEPEKKRLQDVIDTNSKRDERVQGAKQRVQETQGTVGSYGVQSDQHGSNNSGSLLKKIAGFTAAAAGIGSIAAYVAASRSAYRGAIDSESPLYARGLTGTRKRGETAAGIGIAPAEYYDLEQTLSRTTGLNEKHMGKNAMTTAAFAKFSGLETSEVAGLRSNVYQATGSNDSLPNALLVTLGEATKKGLDKARLPELLGMIGRNTHATAQAMAGAGASGEQIGALTRLSTAAMSLKDGSSTKQYAKSAEFQTGVMQNGLQGAGTTSGDIILNRALGMYKSDMTFGDIHDVNVKRQGGFLENPQMLIDVIKDVKSLTGVQSPKDTAGALESTMKSWGIEGKASEKLVEMFDSGFLQRLADSKGQSIESMSKGGDKEAARWLEEIKKNPALSRQSTEATKDFVKIEAGEKLSALFAPMELAAAKFTGALVDGKWQNAFDIFGKAASELGPIGKTLLAGAGLYMGAATLNAAGGAMSMIGGAMGMGGKGGGAMLAAMMGPGGLLAALGLGAVGTHAIFKDGAQGGNYLPEDRKNAITGKAPQQPTAFGGMLNRDVANNPKLSKGYKNNAVSIFNSAKKYGVPENILAGLIESESDFTNVKPRQIKLKGGKTTTVGGIAQFTDETAKRYKIDRMEPGQAIEGAAHLLSDLYKLTGDWREAIKRYKGVVSPENEPQVDTALRKAEKYTKTETERQVLKQSAGSDDNSMQMLAGLLKMIVEHTQTVATNTGQRPVTAQPLPISAR